MKNLVSFHYKKANGEESDRVGFVVRKPTDNYSMLDLTDLSDIEIKEILAEFNKLKNLESEIYKNLPFKYFKESGISEMVEFKS